MSFFACVLFAVIISSSSAAAVEQCRFINSKVDREACYDRQAKELAAKRKPDTIDNEKSKPFDQIGSENERLSKSLRSICRGC